MSSYHFSTSTISRSAGRSATAAAAYRAGCKVVDERTGEIHDYTKKCGVLSTDIVTPDGAPAWAKDPAKLWNAAEAAEKRKDSCVAREVVIALPAELDEAGRRRLAMRLARRIVRAHGCVAQVSIHEPSRDGDDRNHHAHILLTTRRMTPTGFGEKTRELDTRPTGPAHIVRWRAAWAAMQNVEFRRLGLAERVDHRSFEDRGIDREATTHHGPAMTNMLRKAERLASQALAELKALQEVAERATAAAAVAVAVAVSPLPAAAHQVDAAELDDLAEAFAGLDAPAPQAQAPQRPAAPADPRPQAAETLGARQGPGQDPSPAQAQAPAPRGAAPAEAPEGPRVVKTVEAPARSHQAEPPQQPARAQIERPEPVPVAQTGPQERQEAARAALQRVREASARLKAAEAAETHAGAALREARERRNRHWDPDNAAKAEAVAKDQAQRLDKEYRALEARIEGRGVLARMAAKVSDPEAARLEALWPKVQEADRAATEASTRAGDARRASDAAVRASYALRDASQEHQAALRAARTALDAAQPYRAEIEALQRQEAAEREAARLEAERLAQLEADQAERDEDGWDVEA